MSNDIRIVQSSFARKAQAQPDFKFNNLYFLICREDWIGEALTQVLANRGARTAGVDGVTKADLDTARAREEFVLQLRQEMRARSYRPAPVRRVWIPKPHSKQELRPLGIPTIKDRVVQQLLRMVLEPIWESDFLPVSHGFRPRHRTMDCIQPLWRHIHRRQNYWWVIEGDISKCFDRVNHQRLLAAIARRIDDNRVMALLRLLLKAGVMEEGVVHTTEEGTPQGGILSPLLANIYLHDLDVWWQQRWGVLTPKQRQYRKAKARAQGTGAGHVLYWRYADDFILLTNGSKSYAHALREQLRQFLQEELHLELNMAKTQVTHAKDGVDFLGFHIQWMTPTRKRPWLRVTPSAKNVYRFKTKIREMTASNRGYDAPSQKIAAINRVTRGWIAYYRHSNVKKMASSLDYWVNLRVVKWAKRRHAARIRQVLNMYKARQTDNGRNRWNLRVLNDHRQSIWLFKMADVGITRYVSRAASSWQNPYLDATEVVPSSSGQSPLEEDAWMGNSLSSAHLNWAGEAKARAHYVCQGCDRSLLAGEVDQLHTHHRVPKHRGGQYHPRNAQVLCQPCHASVHKSQMSKADGRAV